jgi:serine/threonine protein phosphatase PrpC
MLNQHIKSIHIAYSVAQLSLLYAQGDHLIVANLGDSRAVLCTRDSKDRLIPVQLTTDLKPDLPSEHPNFSFHGYRRMHMNTHLDCILHSCHPVYLQQASSQGF